MNAGFVKGIIVPVRAGSFSQPCSNCTKLNDVAEGCRSTRRSEYMLFMLPLGIASNGSYASRASDNLILK